MSNKEKSMDEEKNDQGQETQQVEQEPQEQPAPVKKDVTVSVETLTGGGSPKYPGS